MQDYTLRQSLLCEVRGILILRIRSSLPFPVSFIQSYFLLTPHYICPNTVSPLLFLPCVPIVPLGISESLDVEISPLGLRSTCIDFGYFRTEFLTPDHRKPQVSRISDYAEVTGRVNDILLCKSDIVSITLSLSTYISALRLSLV